MTTLADGTYIEVCEVPVGAVRMRVTRHQLQRACANHGMPQPGIGMMTVEFAGKVPHPDASMSMKLFAVGLPGMSLNASLPSSPSSSSLASTTTSRLRSRMHVTSSPKPAASNVGKLERRRSAA